MITMTIVRQLPPFGSKPFRIGSIRDYDDESKTWCEYHECRHECGLSVEAPVLLPGTGTIRTPKHVQFIVGTGVLPKKPEEPNEPPFTDLVARKGEIEETFSQLGFTVEVCKVLTKSDVVEALARKTRFRFLFLHGDQHIGLRCCDGPVAWYEMTEGLGNTGLLMILSCYSHEGILDHPDDEYETDCELPDVLFPTYSASRRRVNALITATGRSHHFDWRFQDNSHFEIQRMATLVELCDLHDFETAVRRWNGEIENNLDPVISESIRAHERIRGYGGKICGTPVDG